MVESGQCWDWIPETPSDHGDHVSTPTLSSPRSEPGLCSGLSSLEYWDYSVELECIQGQQDLQLAAELGKTLLERNKELESSLKHQQSVIDDQSLEIEYLTKQTASLREMNESRMKTYEQLELSMIDLERGNFRLSEESLLDKDKIKNLSLMVRQLESRCEDLQRHLDDIVLRRSGVEEVIILRRPEVVGDEEGVVEDKTDVTCQVCDATDALNDEEDDEGRGSPATGAQESGYGSLGYRDTTDDTDDIDNDEEFHTARDKLESGGLDAIYEAEEVIRLTAQISCLRAEIERGDQQIKELEEQMSSLFCENQRLVTTLERSRRRPQLQQNSVEQEVLASEEVSLGKVCGRCFKSSESSNISEVFLLMMRTEVLPVVQRSLGTILCQLLQSSSNVSWLDKWLVIITLATILLGAIRGFLSIFTVL